MDSMISGLSSVMIANVTRNIEVASGLKALKTANELQKEVLRLVEPPERRSPIGRNTAPAGRVDIRV